MSVREFLNEVIPDGERNEACVQRLLKEGVRSPHDVLLCDKDDLRQVGFNMMEANRIIFWRQEHGVHYPPRKDGAAASPAPARPRKSRSRSHSSRRAMARVTPSRSPSRHHRRRSRSRSRSASAAESDGRVADFLRREISPDNRPEVGKRLRQLPRQDALEIMRRDLSSARNVTAVVLARIREAEGHGERREDRDERLASATPANCRDASQRSRLIHDFARRWNLEWQAEDGMAQLHPLGLQRVITGPTLSTARNPTAVVLSRCKEALREFGRFQEDPGAPGGSRKRGRTRSSSRRSDRRRRRRSSRSSSRSKKRSRHRRSPTRSPSHGRGRSPSRSRSRSGSRSVSQQRLKELVQRFVKRNIAPDGIERVTRELLAMPADSAIKVMERDLSSARNPTGVVLQRMYEIRGTQPVRSFVQKYCLDDTCQQALRELTAPQRAWVMAKDLSTARDATAVVMSRCSEAARADPRDLKLPAAARDLVRRDEEAAWSPRRRRRSRSRSRSRSSRSRSPRRISSNLTQDIEDLCADWRLDDSTRSALLALDEPAGRAVLARARETVRGERKGANSAVLSLVKEAKRFAEGSKEVRIRKDHPGDTVGIEFDRGTLRVRGVLPRSPADRAGLDAGYLVVAADGVPISTLAEASKLTGDKTSFTLTVVKCKDRHR
eukprot:TRINITY_DN6433_c1_g1_i1.p1 TRINITY_DN6433_c1_g1~~TRINITY_DN6433_c1_g1_i1.p1  ORF type:complete len:699 (+),score=196.91 TRINITY_DN6433_c1_g1_i1:103-2097(+)